MWPITRAGAPDLCAYRVKTRRRVAEVDDLSALSATAQPDVQTDDPAA